MAESAPQITLYRGWDDKGNYVWSPFVTKLELRLRMAKLPYKVDTGSTANSPKGKVPYIEISAPEKGWQETISDSTLITKQFVENGLLPDLNAELTNLEKLSDLSIKTLLEEKLYWYHRKERWVDNYYTMRDYVLQAVPSFLRVPIGAWAYRGIIQFLDTQGIGRLSNDEIASFRYEIWSSIHAALQSSKQISQSATEPFWIQGKESPTEADAVVFAFICSVLISTAAPDSNRVVRSFPAIMDYAQRIHDTYFPDYGHWN